MAVARHRSPQPAGRAWRTGLTVALALAAVGGAGAWAGGLSGSSSASGRSAVLATSSPWRTGWALSLAHAGQLDGTRLSCRIVAHTSLTGPQVRFRLINYPATGAVTFTHLTAAQRTRGMAVDPQTSRPVTVNGAAAFTLPPGGQVMTDPVELPVEAGDDIALSLSVGAGTSSPWHYWTSQASGCTPAGAGDHTTEASGTAFSERSDARWLSEVQVLASEPLPTFAVYGDSLTDGIYLPVDTGARWTDRLEAATGGRVVALNYGVAGDRITGRAPAGQLPSRVETDVLTPVGLSAVIVEMGSNDIKAGVSAKDILGQYRLMAAAVARTHATFIVATVPPRNDDLPSAYEQQRRLLNVGLRQYPIVADLDRALSDPRHRLSARYDIGDHIHPNDAGVAVLTSVMRSALERVPGALGSAVR
jgi:lysophospholipase L1-like esterase